VRRGPRILGFLYALNKPGGFSEEDVRTLSGLAGAAAVTLENIRLYARERERRLPLRQPAGGVAHAHRQLTGARRPSATVLDQMWRVVRYQAAAAVMHEGHRLRVAASRGGGRGRRAPYAEAGTLRRVFESRRIELLADAA
jgi:GAF domain-containing protein